LRLDLHELVDTLLARAIEQIQQLGWSN